MVLLAVEVEGYEAGLEGQSHKGAFFRDGPGDTVLCHFNLGVCCIGDVGEEIDECANYMLDGGVMTPGEISILIFAVFAFAN